jgi:hypothetical protein
MTASSSGPHLVAGSFLALPTRPLLFDLRLAILAFALVLARPFLVSFAMFVFVTKEM